jgi:transposase InsO family protein
MTRSAVREYAAALRQRYKAGRKAEKGKILDEFCQTTGMHRKAAVRLLNEERRPGSERRGRRKRYGLDVLDVLVQLWLISDRLCGKLLKPILPELLRALERHGELQVSEELRSQLRQISAASIDRLLRIHKRDAVRQPRRQAPAAASLKAQVPIRTWSDWGGVPPGSLQADLVLHCGESTEGFYLATLCAIDVATGWTELQPVWGLGQTRVAAAIQRVRSRLPFPLLSLHTDNGSEFINHRLYAWCRREQVAFSRGRPYRKNDQAYVEQRNYVAVRRLLGNDRLSSRQAYALLQQLDRLLALQLNFLRPVRKLAGKQRLGSRVVKRYDIPRTPYQRLLASGCLDLEQAADLKAVYERLNPAEIQRRIHELLRWLWRLGQEELKLAGRVG